MQSSITHASSRAIIRPPCPKCGTTMMLARIEFDTSGYDRRMFECPTCDYWESAVVRFM